MEPFFFLNQDIDADGFPYWGVCYMDGTEIVQVHLAQFCSEEPADELCEQLNFAYELGYKNCLVDNDIREDC